MSLPFVPPSQGMIDKAGELFGQRAPADSNGEFMFLFYRLLLRVDDVVGESADKLWTLSE